jgi:hypothetical protein
MNLYYFAFVFDVVVIDCRKLQCLGCFQSHNIHTKVNENHLVGSKFERVWHTHTDNMVISYAYFIPLRKKEAKSATFKININNHGHITMLGGYAKLLFCVIMWIF